MRLISRGAEAEIYADVDKIIKKRIRKGYRLKELDEKLRKSRTRREAKILERLPKEVFHPGLIKSDEKSMELKMDFIDGEKVRDILDIRINLCKDIGEIIAEMHNAGIMHGDLTTSNMILSKGKIYLIDFGLSFFSGKSEDRAVDLHLLKQALNSKHHKIASRAFSLVINSYRKTAKNSLETIARLKKVDLRGRNKSKF